MAYDRATDTLVVALREAPIADFGEDGGVVRFKILRASRVVEDTKRVQFATTG